MWGRLQPAAGFSPPTRPRVPKTFPSRYVLVGYNSPNRGIMHKAAISRNLCLALLAASTAQAQTVAAGARAVVCSDTLPVYASMSETAEVKATLVKGDAAIIGLVLFGGNITWCAISKPGQL